MTVRQSERRAGALLGYVATAIGAVLAFGFTPIILGHLGTPAYGVYVLAGSFASYLALLDLGMNDATVRYLVAARTLESQREIENTLAIGFLLYAAISVLVLIAGGVLWLCLPGLFEATMAPEEIATLRLLTVLVVVNVAITLFLNPVGALITSHERFIALRLLDIFNAVGSSLLGIAALLLGYAATGLVVAALLVNLAVLAIKCWFAFSRIGLRPRLHDFSWSNMLGTANYSLPILLVTLVELIYWKLDLFIIGAMIGPSAVAIYAIGTMFQKYAMAFATNLSRVMVPSIIAAVERGEGRDVLTALLVRVARPQALLLMLVVSGLVLFGREFIRLWLGETFLPAYMTLLVTLIPYAFELIGNVRNTVLQAKRLYWYRGMLSLILAIINIGITILLIPRFGILGAAIGTGGGLILGYFGIACLLARKADIDVIGFWRDTWSGIWLGLLIAAAVGVALNLAPGSSWPLFFLRVIAYTSTYCIVMWLVGLNPHERIEVARPAAQLCARISRSLTA